MEAWPRPVRAAVRPGGVSLAAAILETPPLLPRLKRGAITEVHTVEQILIESPFLRLAEPAKFVAEGTRNVD